jgi:hypothetical protein
MSARALCIGQARQKAGSGLPFIQQASLLAVTKPPRFIQPLEKRRQLEIS